MILFFMTVLVSAQTSTAFPFDGLYFGIIVIIFRLDHHDSRSHTNTTIHYGL